MTERLALTVSLILLGVGLYVAGRGAHLRLVGRSGRNILPGLENFQLGQPALLYFSGAHCVPCRTVVKPALHRLTVELENRFQMLEVDAESQTDAVRQWKVLSVPTIFVLDPQGKPRHVHYGAVHPEVLRSELSAWLGPGV